MKSKKRFNAALKIAMLIGLLFSNQAFSQSIFKVYKDNKFKGILAGSGHSSFVDFSNYENLLKPFIGDSKYLIIEQDVRDPEVFALTQVEGRISYFLSRKPSLNDLSEQVDLKCVMNRLNNATSDKSTLDETKKLNPLYYLLSLLGSAKIQPYTDTALRKIEGSVDYIVTNHFQKNHKKIVILEDREAFINVFYEIPMIEYAKSLNNFCLILDSKGAKTYVAANPITLKELGNYFLTGDEKSISQFRQEMNDEWLRMGFTPLAIRQYLESRDVLNSKRIDNYLKTNDGTALILVGLLHLGGEKGLIPNLRKLGYVIKH